MTSDDFRSPYQVPTMSEIFYLQRPIFFFLGGHFEQGVQNDPPKLDVVGKKLGGLTLKSDVINGRSLRMKRESQTLL